MTTGTWRMLCAVGVLVALAGCGTPVHHTAASSSPASAATETPTPLATITTPTTHRVSPRPDPTPTVVARRVFAGPAGLIGDWLVKGTADPGDTVIGFGDPDGGFDDLNVHLRCGTLSGQWQANWSGVFVGYVDLTPDNCVTDAHQLEPSWLASAAGYRVDGADRLLLDPVGRVVARLVPSSAPRVAGWDLSPADPVVTAAIRAALAPGRLLLSRLRPATRAELVGSWVPVGADSVAASRRPLLVLHPGGGWNATDGCNGEKGQWAAGADGTMLSISGLNGAVACTGTYRGPSDVFMDGVAAAGFDGKVLVLVAGDGHTVGRFVRA